MPVVIATITPLPQFRQEVLAALREALPAVHEEPGCQLYALHETDDAFVFVERWSSQDALDRHNDGAAIASVVSKIADKLKEPVGVVVARPVPGGDPVKGELLAQTSGSISQ